MVRIKITETYDLKTQVGKIGIIGIHTPPTVQLAKIWGHAIKSHARIRLAGCNVTMACASVLPADPLQVGVTAGKIAPEDMFNPILYKAVSNEGFDTIVNRIYGLTDLETGGGSISMESNDESIMSNGVYYALLAEGRFKKAMPQTGFTMRGLRPFVHEMLQTYGNGISTSQSTANAGDIGITSTTDIFKLPTGQGTALSGGNRLMRGKAKPMPSIPTEAVYPSTTTGVVQDASFPKTYCGIIITPPAVLNEFYFRLKVSWFIDLFGLRSDLQTKSLANIHEAGQAFHYQAWDYSTSKLENDGNMVDSDNMTLEPIMESDK